MVFKYLDPGGQRSSDSVFAAAISKSDLHRSSVCVEEEREMLSKPNFKKQEDEKWES